MKRSIFPAENNRHHNGRKNHPYLGQGHAASFNGDDRKFQAILFNYVRQALHAYYKYIFILKKNLLLQVGATVQRKLVQLTKKPNLKTPNLWGVQH